MKQASLKIQRMGTVITLQIEHETPELVLQGLDKKLERYEKIFSANDMTSTLMLVNQKAGQEAVHVPSDLFELIKIGKTQSCIEGSYLNIAIGPLVQSWHIGFKDAMKPSQAIIDQKLLLTNPQLIQLDSIKQTIFLEEKGMMLDLGCLAKGYFADEIVKELRQMGVEHALINLGGNVVVMGHSLNNKENKNWKIGIQDPRQERNKQLAIVQVSDQSVVTSGVYERQLKVADKTYHHILNPTTGYPVETEMLSLTVVSKQSLDGEIWTTRLFGKVTEEALNVLNQLSGIEGLIVTTSEVVMSKGFSQYLI